MKSIKEILENYEEYETTLDDRFGIRLCDFLTPEQAKSIGFKFKEEYEKEHIPKEWTKENVIAQLKEDVEFGLEKAYGQRGISSSLMHEVVKSWLKVLEDEELLKIFQSYNNYGIKNFKEVAEKYGFEES